MVSWFFGAKRKKFGSTSSKLYLWAIWLLLLASHSALVLSMIVWIPDLVFLLPRWYICHHVWYFLLKSIFTLFLRRKLLIQVFLKWINKMLLIFFLYVCWRNYSFEYSQSIVSSGFWVRLVLFYTVNPPIIAGTILESFST